MKYQLVLKGIRPVSLNNIYRRKRNGKVYKTSPHRNLEEKVREMLKDSKIECLDCKIKMSIRYELKGMRNIDLDNCSKSLLDILQGIIIDNDNKIFDLHLTKTLGCEENKIIIDYQKLEDA